MAVGDPAWEALGAVERRQRVLDAVKHLVLRESQAQPVALLFEDLHWIDTETQTLLDSLAESLPTARALLLVNYRPEYQHAWGGKSYYTQLRIDPLGGESAAALLDGLLGPGRGMEPLKRMLRERTEGNPFFLEESVRALAEAGVITGERGAFRLAKALDTIQVPATVQAVLAARIDRLPPAVKHLLQSAAVIGKTVPLTLLARVTDTAGLDLRPGLAQLQSAEFLYETTLFPELEYTFKHALTLEVAYRSLLRERRRVLHAAVLGALELRDAHVPESIELLAHHAVHGEVWAPAASYLYRAGAKAQAEARYGPATAYYEACIDALEHLGPAADPALQLDAYLDLWSTRVSTGRVDGLGALGERVEALARARDDGPRLAQVQVRQAQAVALAAAIPGTLSDAVARAREAATRADASDLRTRSYAHFIAGLACRDMGRLTEALDEYETGARLFESVDAALEPGLVYPILVSLRAWRAEAEAGLGRFDMAFASANEALRVARDCRHPSSISIANAFLGYVSIVRGDLLAATSMLEQGLAIAEEHDLPHGICPNGVYLAWASCLSGQHERGLDYLQRGLERNAPAALQWTRYGSVTATAYLAAGRPDDARRAIEAGLTAASERGARGYLGPLWRLEADVLLAEGELDLARVRAGEALAIAEELATQPEIARCHETFGRIATQAGDPSGAEHFRTARRIFEELGMEYWAARVAAVS